MSRTFAVACDACGHPIDTSSGWSGWSGRWLEITPGRSGEKLDFCDWECLVSYGRDMLEKIAESNAETP